MYFTEFTIYLFSPWIEQKQISTFPEILTRFYVLNILFKGRVGDFGEASNNKLALKA